MPIVIIWTVDYSLRGLLLSQSCKTLSAESKTSLLIDYLVKDGHRQIDVCLPSLSIFSSRGCTGTERKFSN